MQKSIFTFFAIASFAAATVCAQTPSGSLRGIVADAQGARVASATITVHLEASPLERPSEPVGKGTSASTT